MLSAGYAEKTSLKKDEVDMVQELDRPEDRGDMFAYLDRLKDTGIVNMFFAATHLQETFDIDWDDAKEVHQQWMSTYSDRHPPHE